ncbi:MAG: hypothetical protein ACO29W_00010 [Burkholderiaceae bacterium]|jgi:hypothetical protein
MKRLLTVMLSALLCAVASAPVGAQDFPSRPLRIIVPLEPHKDHWHVQDMILVREGAPELLSDSFNTDEAVVVDA